MYAVIRDGPLVGFGIVLADYWEQMASGVWLLVVDEDGRGGCGKG
jgi:hypothetical protein